MNGLWIFGCISLQFSAFGHSTGSEALNNVIMKIIIFLVTRVKQKFYKTLVSRRSWLLTAKRHSLMSLREQAAHCSVPYSLGLVQSTLGQMHHRQIPTLSRHLCGRLFHTGLISIAMYDIPINGIAHVCQS